MKQRNTSGIEKHKWQKGKSGNPKGRPRKLVSHINAELQAEGFEPVSVSEVTDCFLTLINLPLKKLQTIAVSEDDYPFLYRLVSKELLGNRGADMLEKLLDRGHGKSKNSVDITSAGQRIAGFQSLDEAFWNDVEK